MQRSLITLAVVGQLLALAQVPTAWSVRASDSPLASPWIAGHNTRARLVAGGHPTPGPDGAIAAGLEIEIAEGWKTYWRDPGSSGAPPHFDWSPSANLAGADVLFPAPKRLADRAGDTIGYKGTVTLPIVVRATDPARPVKLAVDVEYGVCKDICIPVHARIELAIPPGSGKGPASGTLAEAFDRVPRTGGARRPGDPRLRASHVTLTGEKPSIRLEAEFPGGADAGDIFLEVPDGVWLPMAQRDGAPKGDIATFLVDLSDGAEIADLKGKTARVTLVSPRGQSETTIKIE